MAAKGLKAAPHPPLPSCLLRTTSKAERCSTQSASPTSLMTWYQMNPVTSRIRWISAPPSATPHLPNHNPNLDLNLPQHQSFSLSLSAWAVLLPFCVRLWLLQELFSHSSGQV